MARNNADSMEWEDETMKEPFIKRGIGIDNKVQVSESGKIKTIQMIMVNTLLF